jgi:hypothetical protein
MTKITDNMVIFDVLFRLMNRLEESSIKRMENGNIFHLHYENPILVR